MSEELLRARAALQKTIEIRELRPFRMVAELLHDAPPAGTELALAIDHRVEVKPDDGGFALMWVFDLRFTAPGATQHFAHFAYSSVTRYGAPGDLPPDEVIASFADSNGFLHVWPYVRSWVHSSCGNMQIAAAPLPVVRFRTELAAVDGSSK